MTILFFCMYPTSMSEIKKQSIFDSIWKKSETHYGFEKNEC